MVTSGREGFAFVANSFRLHSYIFVHRYKFLHLKKIGKNLLPYASKFLSLLSSKNTFPAGTVLSFWTFGLGGLLTHHKSNSSTVSLLFLYSYQTSDF